MPDLPPDDEPRRLPGDSEDPVDHDGADGEEADDRDPDQRVRDELDRIFLANLEAAEPPWKTWRRPAAPDEAGAWWRPFAYLAALALVVVVVLVLTR